jgi:hypothetical protein
MALLPLSGVQQAKPGSLMVVPPSVIEDHHNDIRRIDMHRSDGHTPAWHR